MPDGKIVFLTGGTGSFGQAFTARLLKDSRISMVRIFSRDEHKQAKMRRDFPDRVSFFIGDIRDEARLIDAMQDSNYVVHAAALKQAPLGEIEPGEFIKTNIFGSMNVISASRKCGVEKSIFISSDKAVEPWNLYGATKMCAERLFIQADAMRGLSQTRFAMTRYGNVAWTNGSIIPTLMSLPSDEPTPIYDDKATRFWITLDKATDFVFKSLMSMRGGEIFIPPMKSARVVDIAQAVRPDKPIKILGSRHGDKRHEVISVNGTRKTSDLNEFMTIEEIRKDALDHA